MGEFFKVVEPFFARPAYSSTAEGRQFFAGNVVRLLTYISATEAIVRVDASMYLAPIAKLAPIN